jgi:hypothetical protein
MFRLRLTRVSASLADAAAFDELIREDIQQLFQLLPVKLGITAPIGNTEAICRFACSIAAKGLFALTHMGQGKSRYVTRPVVHFLLSPDNAA